MHGQLLGTDMLHRSVRCSSRRMPNSLHECFHLGQGLHLCSIRVYCPTTHNIYLHGVFNPKTVKYFVQIRMCSSKTRIQLYINWCKPLLLSSGYWDNICLLNTEMVYSVLSHFPVSALLTSSFKRTVRRRHSMIGNYKGFKKEIM